MDIVVLANQYKVHHFKNLEDYFKNRFIYEPSYDPQNVLKHDPQLVVCFDEHWCELGHVISHLSRAGVATLQVMDGILEWRRTWDYEWQGHKVDGIINPINQPALAHKIACLGKKDKAILESWGNLGKCEIVGAPRFDAITKKGEQTPSGMVGRKRGGKPIVLVMTAKTPGFTQKQRETAMRALFDLKAFFAGRNDLSVMWRITNSLHKELGVENELSDLSGQELHFILDRVDAVITTPSTAMLESMLVGRPTALLDYHNCPHYFDAAWNIYCPSHISDVVDELIMPNSQKMEYQRFLLNEQLCCIPTAKERLIVLMEGMLNIKKQSVGIPLRFPAQMLPYHPTPHLCIEAIESLKEWYPDLPVPANIDKLSLEVELSAARGTVRELYAQIANLERKLTNIPGYQLARRIRKALRGK